MISNLLNPDENLILLCFSDLGSFSIAKQFLLKITVNTLYIINYTINPFTYYYLNEFFQTEVTELFRKVQRCSSSNADNSQSSQSIKNTR